MSSRRDSGSDACSRSRNSTRERGMPGVLTRSFLEEVVRGSGWTLAEVESLSLEGEGISSLGDGCPFEGARRLVHLDLSRNHLSSLRGIEDLTSLATLVLRENRIDNIAEVGRLAYLPDLRSLDLRFNPVMSTARMSSSQDRILGGSGRSWSSGGGSSGGSSRSSKSNGSSSMQRAGIVAVVPQLESLNGRRVLDDERWPPRSQQCWREEGGKDEGGKDEGGKDEDEQPQGRQHRRRQGKQEQQEQQEQQKQQRQQSSGVQKQRQQFQHQHQLHLQRPGEHRQRRGRPLRPHSATGAPATHDANSTGTLQAIEDDRGSGAPTRGRVNDGFEAGDGGRDSSNVGLRPDTTAASRSHDGEEDTLTFNPCRHGQTPSDNDFSLVFPAGASAAAKLSSDSTVQGQHRVATAVHVNRNTSARGIERCATSPTGRDSTWRRADHPGADDSNVTLTREDVGQHDRFVQQGRDSRVAERVADTCTVASTVPSASDLPAAVVAGGASSRRGRRGAENVAGIVTISRSYGSKGMSSGSSPGRSENVGSGAPDGGNIGGSRGCRDGGPREPPSVAEHACVGAGEMRPKATPPPLLPLTDARADASSPAVTGTVVATPAARTTVEDRGNDGAIGGGDGTYDDLATLWRELQGADESLCSGGSGNGDSHRRKPLKLSSLRSASHSSSSLANTATASATGSKARNGTTAAPRTHTPESSGAARAVAAFRQSSQRLGLLPAPGADAGNSDGGGSGGYGYNDLSGRGGEDVRAHHCEETAVSGQDGSPPTAETIAVPVRASACRRSGEFNSNRGDPGFGSHGSGNGANGGGGGGSGGSGRYTRTGHGDFNMSPVEAQPSPTEALLAAAVVDERVLPSAGLTDIANVDSDSRVTTFARASGSIPPGLAATVDAPAPLISVKPRSGVAPATTTTGKCTALDAGGLHRGGLVGEKGAADAEVWAGASAERMAGAEGGDARKAEEEERWCAREREFAPRWAAREKEFEERWAAREREIEQRRREDSSQGFTAEMRSMLFDAHKALISSNAWLVERLKTLEAAAAVAAAPATHPARVSEAHPESVAAPAPIPVNATPTATPANNSSQNAVAVRQAAVGRSTVSRRLPPACRQAADEIDGNAGGAPSLGRSRRGIDTEATSSSPFSSYHLACNGVGVDPGAASGAGVDRPACMVAGTATGVPASARSRRREGEGTGDRGPDIPPECSAVAAVESDLQTAMAGFKEMLRPRRESDGIVTPNGIDGNGAEEVPLGGRSAHASVAPAAARSHDFSDEGSAVGNAVARDSTAGPPLSTKNPQEPCVEGPSRGEISHPPRAAVAAASRSPLEGTVKNGEAAAPPDRAPTPSMEADEGLHRKDSVLDGPKDRSAGTVVAALRRDDGGGVFGVDPEVTVSASRSH